jgi:hypothetical protein
LRTKKRHIDLTEPFDSVDLGVESIGDWSAFEKEFYGKYTSKKQPG